MENLYKIRQWISETKFPQKTIDEFDNRRLVILRHSRHYFINAATYELKRENFKEADKALIKLDEIQSNIDFLEN